MSRCKFCGLPVEWTAGDRRVPLNSNGKDHRETCVGMGRDYRHVVRDHNHEDRVSAFLKTKGIR